jgi:hypothetical protein
MLCGGNVQILRATFHVGLYYSTQAEHVKREATLYGY